MRPDEHPASTVTATPVFHQGRLYVGSALARKRSPCRRRTPCCTFRGSETAVDAATGKVLWKRYMIAEAAKERPKGRRGLRHLGSFRSRSVDGAHARSRSRHHVRDYRRQLLRSHRPDERRVVALRLSTGEILWSKQFTAKDAWNSSCQLPGR